MIKWFPHYIDAMGRDSITALINRFNGQGYSVWFGLLEKICQELKENRLYLDLTDPEDIAKLSGYCMVPEEKLLEILDYCAKIHLIDTELWNQKIVWIEQLWKNLKSAYKKEFPYAPGRTPPEKEKKKTLPAEAIEIARLIYEFNKRRDVNLKDMTNAWAKDIDKMHRIDKRPYEEMKKVWQFIEAQASSPYPYVIISGISFRSKYTKILQRMLKEKPKNTFSGVIF